MKMYRQKLDTVLKKQPAIPYTAGMDLSGMGRRLVDPDTGEEFLSRPGVEPLGPLKEGDYLVLAGPGVLVLQRKEEFEADWEPMPEPAPKPTDPGVT